MVAKLSTIRRKIKNGDKLGFSERARAVNKGLLPSKVKKKKNAKQIVLFPDEIDVYNNSMVQRFSIHKQIEAPFIETFESNSFSTMHWKIINSDDEASWELSETNGLDNSYISAKAALFNYGNI